MATVDHVDADERGRADWALADAEVRRTLAEEQGLSDDEIKAIDDEIDALLDAGVRRQFAAREAARADAARSLDDARERRDAAGRKSIRVWLGSSLATMLVVGTVSGDFNTGMDVALYVLLFAPFALAGVALLMQLVIVPFAIVEKWQRIRRRRTRQNKADA